MRRRKIHDRELLELRAQGWTQEKLAARFGCSAAAVIKRLLRLKPPPLPESLEKLTEQQRKFCAEVASGQTRTEAALQTYECGSRESAKAIGGRLMLRDDIKAGIETLMDEAGLTKRYRVQKLKEHVDSDFNDVSLRALDQTWKLDGSYSSEGRAGTPATYIQINLKTGERETEERRGNPDIVLHKKGKSYITTTGGEEHE
jgi:transcriptional regulator with XRE-family HTH domain